MPALENGPARNSICEQSELKNTASQSDVDKKACKFGVPSTGRTLTVGILILTASSELKSFAHNGIVFTFSEIIQPKTHRVG